MNITYEDLGQPDYYLMIEKKGCKELKGEYFNLLFYFVDGIMRAQHYHPYTEDVIREVIVENSRDIFFEMDWFSTKELLMKKMNNLLVD